MDTVFHGRAGELRIGEPALYVDNRSRRRSGHMSHAMAASAEPTAHCLLNRIIIHLRQTHNIPRGTRFRNPGGAFANARLHAIFLPERNSGS